MSLLIAIPTKTAPEYLERAASCEATWLKDCPVDYKFFRDADWGLDENDLLVRQKRMKVMCRYALDHGYDFVFRVDSDAYVWVDRLLACGFEQYDYMGYCAPRALNAGGGTGFFLSRRAMQIVIDGPHFPMGDKIYWGDMWTGKLLDTNGISCHSDGRFLDGCGMTDITPDSLPADHGYISLHPVSSESQRGFHGF